MNLKLKQELTRMNIGRVILFAGVLVAGLVWMLNLPSGLENTLFVGGLAAIVVGSLIESGTFKNKDGFK